MTAAREPQHPDQRVRDVAASVTPVDVSGHSSTIASDSLTLGQESLDKAYRGGFSAQLGSPAGPSLLTSYMRWREREALAKASQEAKARTPAELEARAHKRGVKKAGKKLAKGHSRDSAFASGFVTYKTEGGKLGLQGWVRKCAR
jgi:hypothetical protein